MPAPFILALGDSLTAGYGLARSQSFTARLEALLDARTAGARVLNAGVSGDTSAGGLARLPRLLSGMTAKPDLAIVALGANDLLRGVAPARIRENLAAILAQLADCGVPAMLAGMLAPPFLPPPFVAAFNGLWPSLADQYDVPLYPFFLDGVVGDPALVLADGIHPNARAIGIVADRILPHVLAALARTRG